MLASETAPRSPKPGRQGKSPRKGKRAAARRNRSPGPGAYDLPGSIGSSKTGSAKYSFGTADRNAYLTQYLSKTQSQTSSAFGRGSPGPASYNTRTSITLVGRNRSPSNFSRSTRGQKLKAESPGPIYWPSIDEVSVHSRGPAYSVGSGHADPSVTSVESPGPCYDVAGERTPSKTRMPAYTMGGGREGPGSPTSASAAGPGPGAYATNAKDASMHRPPIFTVKGGTSRTAPLKGNGLPGPNHYSPSRDDDIGANPRSPMGKAPRMPPPNGFATAVPGPGTYEAHTVNVGSAAPAFSVRPKHAVLAGSTAVPGPKYDTRQSPGARSPTFSFSHDARKDMGKPGGGPGPGAYEASIELGVSAGAPAYSLGASDKESLNKRYLSAGHQKALTKTGGPGPGAHSHSFSNRHNPPEYSWGFAERDTLGIDSAGPGPAAYNVDNAADMKNRPPSYSMRLRAEKDSRPIKKSGSSLIGNAHNFAGRESPSFSFSRDERFMDDY